MEKIRQCKYCNKTLPIKKFEIANVIKGKEYRRWKCSSCYQGTKRKRRQIKAQWFEEYKKTCKCKKCGNNDFRVLIFHHRISSEKDADVSVSISSWGIEKIKKEIDKCDVLCANCHLILHYDLRHSQGVA